MRPPRAVTFANVFVVSIPVLIMPFSMILVLALVVAAQGQDNAAFKSAEVHPDRSVTFRYKDAAASKVILYLDGVAEPQDMKKGDDGVWSLVTLPLAPQIYGYTFVADGQPRLDPNNPAVTPNLIYHSNAVTVPGSSPQLWEARDVPHGAVHHHFYTSKVVSGLVDGQSEYFVYTPPNYDPKNKRRYPVLYLLHGWSDMTNGWIEVGKANFILDNLFAEGKVEPMLVVMPLGYGDMKFVTSGEVTWNDDTVIDRNVSLFSQSLLTEILPQIESTYHVSKKRDDRAITGLSMGGLESLTIGLGHPELFGWVGGFSSALGHREKDDLANLNVKTTGLHLLWIACGTDDDLITPNRRFISWLKTKNVPVTAVETPGMHNWMVWRDNLAHFALLIFQNGK
jgi:enterochelin esterase-like enzyme